MIKRFLYFLFLALFFSTESYSQTTTLTTGTVSGAFSWTVPCGVTSITVSAWGGGGGGGNSTTAQAGGGGGSGGYSQTVFTTTIGSVLTFTVGAGGAGGGTGSNGSNGGTTTFGALTAGGGGGGSVTATGGGAGGVGSTNNGNVGVNPSGTTGGNGGSAPSGGAGGAGGTIGNDGSNGTVPGGGGGAAGQRSGGAENSGNGANGRVTIAFVFPDINAAASSTLASCNTTTAALTATAISAPGWTGSWQCVACTGVTIANTASASTTASGFVPGSANYFQWIATYSTGCSYYDDLTITVPACPITNNNCANATTLAIDAGLMCGQSTTGGSVEAGECYVALSPPNAGASAQSLWYRFTATNDSLVLNIAGYGTNGPPSISVFGPFASGAGCVPACSSTVVAMQGLAGDPGVHQLLTGLATTGNNQYLVSVTGFANLNWDFCININNPASNSTTPANALVISNCGATYNGATNGGYFQSGTSTGFNNLDGNAGTTCGTCGEAGDDVSFIVNNLSWFKFCTVNAGTFNVQFDVLSCVFSGLNHGSQMAILTGTNNNMTNIWQASNPTYTNTATQTSPNFTLAAGGCAYLVVDGFAGDACSYSYVLTNVTGGCVLLPIELLSFNAIQKENSVELTWATATELNNDFYTIERSEDGINFKEIEKIDGAGISSDVLFYSTKDVNPLNGLSYYRLKQTDFSGRNTYSKMVSVEYKNTNDLEFKIVPNPSVDNEISNIVLNTIPNGEVTIEITDTQGEMLYEVTKKSETNKIEIPNYFSKGIYFVKVIHSDFIQTKRMMIK